MNKERTTIYLSKKVKDDAFKEAKAQGLSLSALITTALNAVLREKK